MIKVSAFQELKVAKALISKADLKRIALQEIRAFPGSDHVISVEVECETGPLEFQI